MIREAVDGDAAGIAALIVELGYPVTAEDVTSRMTMLRALGHAPLVAEDESGRLIGCVTISRTPVLHRDAQVGRLSMLVVTADRRSSGTGTGLVREAETRLAALGCKMVEVTSNLRRAEAHRFYERLGYERSSYRFGKQIGPE